MCTNFTYDVANQLKSITYSDNITPNVSNMACKGDGQRTGVEPGLLSRLRIDDRLHVAVSGSIPYKYDPADT